MLALIYSLSLKALKRVMLLSIKRSISSKQEVINNINGSTEMVHEITNGMMDKLLRKGGKLIALHALAMLVAAKISSFFTFPLQIVFTENHRAQKAVDKEIFLSYEHEKKILPFVTRLKNDLEKRGFHVWLDLNDLSAGSDWHGVIGV